MLIIFDIVLSLQKLTKVQYHWFTKFGNQWYHILVIDDLLAARGILP